MKILLIKRTLMREHPFHKMIEIHSSTYKVQATLRIFQLYQFVVVCMHNMRDQMYL